MIFSYFEKRLKRESPLLCRHIYRNQNPYLYSYPRHKINERVLGHTPALEMPLQKDTSIERNEYKKKDKDKGGEAKVCSACMGQGKYACLYCSYGCSICKNTNYVDCKTCGGKGTL